MDIFTKEYKKVCAQCPELVSNSKLRLVVNNFGLAHSRMFEQARSGQLLTNNGTFYRLAQLENENHELAQRLSFCEAEATEMNGAALQVSIVLE